MDLAKILVKQAVCTQGKPLRSEEVPLIRLLLHLTYDKYTIAARSAALYLEDGREIPAF